MDWIKQNKFLAGYLAFLVVAGGAFGFLIVTAKGKYDQAYQTYQSKAQDLSTLQNKQPYPSEANVKKMQEAQKAHQAAIDTLQKDLAKAQVPLKSITPEKFQDNLRESIRRVTALAGDHHVTLPKDKFFMGFETYQSSPPKPEAAPALQRELDAIEKAVTILIESNISELTADLKRDPLPEETKPEAASSTAKKTPQGKAASAKPLVERHGFEVQLVSAEPNFRASINKLVSSKELFLIPAVVQVQNEAKAPLKIDPNASVANPNTPPGVPPSPQDAPTTKYVFGDEKLTVTARIEIVNFAELTAK